MKINKTYSLISGLALAALLVAGCVSQSYDKGAATAAALQNSANAVSETSARVNEVLATLNNLTFKPQGDLRTQFDAFKTAAAKLNDSTGKLDSAVMDMRIRAANYFANWTNELATIQSDEIRKRSSTRRDEVVAKLQAVDASYSGVKDAFHPFISDVKDIQTYLGTDLTVGGLDTIRDIVARTKTDAVPLREAVKKIQANFSELSLALSPVVPASGK